MPKKRKKRRTSATRRQDYPGWVWMLFGLAIGLSVALAIYMRAEPPPVRSLRTVEPASLDGTVDDPPESAQPVADAPEDSRESRFTFYDMLPNFEVVIPEQEPHVTADTGARTVVEPGLYVLQAGSFTHFEDADRRRAELALQGIESTIQRVTIDDKTYHRVRIGPTDDLDELNLLRSRLHTANIDVLRIRLGE